MELTPGILKAVESAFIVNGESHPMYVLKYNGKLFYEGGSKVRLFATEGSAKSKVTTFVRDMFRHASYWQSCASHIKSRSGYEVDFSALHSILPSYGPTARFEDPKNKKMFKEIATNLLAAGIFTIEKLS